VLAAGLAALTAAVATSGAAPGWTARVRRSRAARATRSARPSRSPIT